MDPLLSTLLMVAVMMIVFNMLVARPAKKKAAEQAAAVDAMQPGTRVMTTAGVFGTVRYVGDKQAVVEISPGVEMTILKQAISKVVDPAEDEFEYDDEDAEVDPVAAAPASALTGSTVAAATTAEPVPDRDDEFDRVVDLDTEFDPRPPHAGHARVDETGPDAAPRPGDRS